MRGRLARRRTLALALAMLVVGLSGCSGTALQPLPVPSVSHEQGIVYSSVGGEELLLDACVPRTGRGAGGGGERPAVMLIHGGAFVAGGRTSMDGLCQDIAERGLVAVTIDYRLLPEHVFPAQQEDALAALRWLATSEQAADWGVDPDRIGLVGSSAGAIIAMSAALDSGAAEVAAFVSLSGASDLTPAALTLGEPGDDAQRIILGYLGCRDLRSCPTAPAASPRYQVTRDSPPMLLVTGSHELVPAEQAEAMRDAMVAQGASAEVVTVTGARHGLELLSPAVLRRVEAFLAASL